MRTHTERWSLRKCQNEKGVGPIFKTKPANERTNEQTKKKMENQRKESRKKIRLQKWHCSVEKAFPIVPLLETYFVCVSAILHVGSHSCSPFSPGLVPSVKHTITFEIRWWPFKHLIGIAQTNLYI